MRNKLSHQQKLLLRIWILFSMYFKFNNWLIQS